MLTYWGASASAGASAGATSTILIPRRPPPTRTLCMASNINSEQLRTQLDQLHSEAQNISLKANNARLRLIRLSEAAEKLRREAAISVRTGRENEARDLLLQKKQVMQALEKSKSRIELLDEFSVKLNEAISIKESELIGNVASDLGFDKENASSPVRIVSPKEEAVGNSTETGNIDLNELKLCEDEDLQVHGDGEIKLSTADKSNDLEDSFIWGISSLKEISSYWDFLEHLDRQFIKIEAELLTVLRFSALVLESEEKPKNSKVQKAVEILEGVQQIRRRIATIRQNNKVESR